MAAKRKTKKPIEDYKYAAELDHKLRLSINSESGTITHRRSRALHRYRREPYGKKGPNRERAGHSSVRTAEVFEVVEWTKPFLLRTFLGSRDPTSLEPFGPEDEPKAAQESDVCNYWLRRNWSPLATWFSEGLISPVSYIAPELEKRKRICVETYSGLGSQEVLGVLTDDSIQDVLELVDEATGEPPDIGDDETPLNPTSTYTLKVKLLKEDSRMVLHPVPGEEMLVDSTATTLDLDEVEFVARRRLRPIGELVAEGYDEETIREHAQTNPRLSADDESFFRRNTVDEDPDSPMIKPESMERVEFVEAYWKYDDDDDGVPEWRRIVRIGSAIYENEYAEMQPYVALSCIPHPFRHVGESLAEVVIDLQDQSTSLTRQLNDNLYRGGTRRLVINEQAQTDNTLRDMADVSSMFVRVRGIPQQAVTPEPYDSMAGDLIPALQRIDERTTLRSGISPQLQLNPDVLREGTAHAVAMATDPSANQRLEMLVRYFAESVRKLVIKIHGLLRLHQDKEMVIRLRGQWIATNPMEWDERYDATVQVGLGTNNQQQRAQSMMQLLQVQREALAANLTSPQHIANALRTLVEDLDVGHFEKYFIDPQKTQGWQPPEPQKDPVAEAQTQVLMAQAQGEQVKVQSEQAKVQREQQLHQLKVEEMQEKRASEQAKLMMDYETKMFELGIKQLDTERTTKFIPEKTQAEIMKILKELRVMNAEVEEKEAKAEATLNPPQTKELDKSSSGD